MLFPYRQLLAGLILMSLAWSVQGAIVSDLYQSEVAVASRSNKDRTQALGHALAEVLIKVSGRSDVTSHSTIETALNDADQWLVRYAYEVNQLDETDDLDNSSDEQLFLVATFDEAAIERLLTQAGLPIWGQNRPTILAWIAVEQPLTNDRELVNANADRDDPLQGDIASYLTTWASQRGVPVVFPLLDLEDTNQIDVSDVWGLFAGPVSQASNRYRSEVSLAGRIYQNRAGRWEGAWMLLIENQQMTWQQESNDLDELMDLTVNRMSDAIASRYAIVNSPQSQDGLTMRVQNVNGIVAFEQVVEYLRDINGVSSVEVVNLSLDELTLDIQFNGSINTFEQTLARDRILVAEAQMNVGQLASTAIYRYTQ